MRAECSLMPIILKSAGSMNSSSHDDLTNISGYRSTKYHRRDQQTVVKHLLLGSLAWYFPQRWARGEIIWLESLVDSVMRLMSFFQHDPNTILVRPRIPHLICRKGLKGPWQSFRRRKFAASLFNTSSTAVNRTPSRKTSLWGLTVTGLSIS